MINTLIHITLNREFPLAKMRELEQMEQSLAAEEKVFKKHFLNQKNLCICHFLSNQYLSGIKS